MSKLENIKSSLNNNEIGSIKDKEYIDKLENILKENEIIEREDLPLRTRKTITEVLSLRQANVQFMSGVGYIHSKTATGEFLDVSELTEDTSVSQNTGLYFSNHTDGVDTAHVIIKINEKSRLWTLPTSASSIAYDVPILVYKKIDGVFSFLPLIQVVANNRNDLVENYKKFYLSTDYLEQGEYMFIRSNVYSSHTEYQNDLYAGLRTDSKWFFEKY